ncbi:hypothetical protein MMPV_005294 [Pyropia vietnamensis]
MQSHFPDETDKPEVPSGWHDSQLVPDVLLMSAAPPLVDPAQPLVDPVGAVQEQAGTAAGAGEHEFSAGSGPGLIFNRNTQLGSLEGDNATPIWDHSLRWEPASGTSEDVPQVVAVPAVQPTNDKPDGDAANGDLSCRDARSAEKAGVRRVARIEHWRRCRAKISKRLGHMMYLLPASPRAIRHKADLLAHATRQVVHLQRTNTRLELELATRNPNSLYPFLRDRAASAATLIDALEIVLQLTLGPTFGWAAAEVWAQVPAVAVQANVQQRVQGGVKRTQGTPKEPTTTVALSGAASEMAAAAAISTPATTMRVVWARFADGTGRLGGTIPCSSDKTGCTCATRLPRTAAATAGGMGGGSGDGVFEDDEDDEESLGSILWMNESPTARALRRVHSAMARTPGFGRSAEVEAAARTATESPFPHWHSRDVGGAIPVAEAAVVEAAVAAAAEAATATAFAAAPPTDASAAGTAAKPVAPDVAATLTVPVPLFTPALARSLMQNPHDVARLLESAMAAMRATGQTPSSAADGAIYGGGGHPSADVSSPLMPVAEANAAVGDWPGMAAYTGAAAVIVLTDITPRPFDSHLWELITCMAWVVGAAWTTNPASATPLPVVAGGWGDTAGLGSLVGGGFSRLGGRAKGGVAGGRRTRGVPPAPAAADSTGSG